MEVCCTNFLGTVAVQGRDIYFIFLFYSGLESKVKSLGGLNLGGQKLWGKTLLGVIFLVSVLHFVG